LIRAVGNTTSSKSIVLQNKIKMMMMMIMMMIMIMMMMMLNDYRYQLVVVAVRWTKRIKLARDRIYLANERRRRIVRLCGVENKQGAHRGARRVSTAILREGGREGGVTRMVPSAATAASPMMCG